MNAFRVLVAIVSMAGAAVATNVGIINPFGDLLILVLTAALTVIYLQKTANLGYVFAALVVIAGNVFAAMIYRNVSSSFYKAGLIVVGISVVVMVVDLLKRWRHAASASGGHS